MSKYQIQISFDRDDRTYHFGEQVTGRVLLMSQSGFTCNKLWLEYFWRTHGQGNKDKGKNNSQEICSEPVQFEKGDQREFPFAFPAPSGPVTYHGKNLNVDWYLLARADVPFGLMALDLKCEEDFILVPSEYPDKYILGSFNKGKHSLVHPPPHQEIQRQVIPLNTYNEFSRPQKDPFSRISVSLLWLTVIFALGSFTILMITGTSWWEALIAGFILSTFFALGLNFLLKTISRQIMKISALQVEPHVVYAGEQANCLLLFEPKAAVFLEDIAAQLSADEECTSGAGTNSSTSTHNLIKNIFVKPFHEDLLPGRQIEFECVLPVPPDAPATFQAANNNIKWSVKLKVSFKRWPAWEKTFSITVLPAYFPEPLAIDR